MTRSSSAPRHLTVPQALMTLVHTDAGQPYRRLRPAVLTAAAELAELAVRGDVDVDDGHLTAARPSSDGPPWRDEVTATLASRCSTRPVHLPTWLRQRYDAYEVHREQAAAQGVLVAGRERWFGVLPYRTHVAVPAARERVLRAITDPAGAQDPRSAALAALVLNARVDAVLDLSAEQEDSLRRVADGAHGGAAPVGLDSMTTALATVGYVVLTGG